jgi:hypothetical protein
MEHGSTTSYRLSSVVNTRKEAMRRLVVSPCSEVLSLFNIFEHDGVAAIFSSWAYSYLTIGAGGVSKHVQHAVVGNIWPCC